MKAPTEHLKEIEILTNRYCNLKCKFCDAWTNPIDDKSVLTYNQLKSSIKSIHDWLKKPMRLSLAGGESFMRKDLLEIISYAESLQFTTSVITNGTLITEEIAKKIISSNLSAITFSIDSLNPKIHDYLRGVSGTLKKALQGIQFINKHKIQKPWVSLAVVINNLNYNGLLEIVQFAKNNNISSVLFQPISPIFFGGKTGWYDSKIWPTNKNEVKNISNAIDLLIKAKENGESKIFNSIQQLTGMKNYFKEIDLKKVS